MAKSKNPFQWTQDREHLLRQLRHEGRSSAYIAAQLGCSADTARIKANSIGLGCEQQKSGKWPSHEVQKLKELHALGLSFSQIAAEFGDGRTRNSCLGKGTRLGLPERGVGAKKSGARQDYIVVDTRLLRLVEKYEDATLFEISEAVAVDFAETVEQGRRIDPDRDPGSPDFYRPHVVARMRAELREAA